MDFVLLALVVGLTVLGLIILYSASFIYAQERFADGFYFLKRQGIFTLLGFVAMFVGYRIDSRQWLRLRLPLMLLAMFLLALVLVPGVGTRVGGALRWLRLGVFGFQPGEFAKYAVVLFVAGQLFRKRDRIHTFGGGMLASYAWVLPVVGLLLLQPDFGTSVMIVLVVTLLMFLAGVPGKFLAIAGAGAVAAGAALVIAAPYRVARFMAFMNPWDDPQGKGFQILQSMLGFHHGQLTGLGLGNGKEKLFFLPEAHSDFIFAVLGEELGFIGVALVVAGFILFLYRGLTVARRLQTQEHDMFGALLASGITLLMGLQALVNIAVVMGLLPTKGLPLPFISYGGSGMVINLFAVGVLLNLARSTQSQMLPRSAPASLRVTT